MGKKDKEKEKTPKAPKAAKSGGGGGKKGKSGFLLEKGEKLLMVLGGAGLVGLLALGAMSFADSSSPDVIVTGLKSKTSTVQMSLTSPGEGAPPLPEWVTKKAAFEPVPSQHFALNGTIFEPIYQPDLLRENPRVLGIVSSQIEPIRGPMRALDIQETDAGMLLGVLMDMKLAPKESSIVAKSLQGVIDNYDRAKKFKNRGMPGAPRGGFPRQPQPPMPPGAAQQQPAVDQFGNPITGVAADLRRTEKSVSYLPPEEVQAKNLPLAETVYPLRAMLVQAAFPLKAQIEEIKRALRLQSKPLNAANPQNATGPMPPIGDPRRPGQPMVPGMAPANELDPVFDGFRVERKEIDLDGNATDWMPYDHESEYFVKIRARKVADVPDAEYLPYFLRYDQKLAAPLPQMANNLGTYPGLKIAEIFESIDKLRDVAEPAPTESDWQKRFKTNSGDQNPYAPFSGVATSSTINTSTELPPGSGFGPPRTGFGPAASMQPQQQTGPNLDYLLLRFLDVDVRPGYSYQYRIQVRMKNPNFGKESEVSEPSDAKKEFLEGPWVEIPDIVTFPPDHHLYAYDPAQYVKAAEDVSRYLGGSNTRNVQLLNFLFDSPYVKQGKHAAIQMQTWMMQVRSSGVSNEPVGNWVVTEMPAIPGEYIGRRQLVKLPLWSSSLASYVLRELSNVASIVGLPTSIQPKGWVVDFGTKLVLVDFEGGNLKTTVDGKSVEDSNPTELLILLPDGKLTIHNSAKDMADPKRIAREDNWTKWLNDVQSLKQPTTPGTGGTGFDSRLGK